MKKLISILALGAVFNIAHADGFAPWTARPAADATEPAAAVAAPGFAPWRDGPGVMDVPDATQISDSDLRHGFSPWS